jgi:hypothetical protein
MRNRLKNCAPACCHHPSTHPAEPTPHTPPPRTLPSTIPLSHYPTIAPSHHPTIPPSHHPTIPPSHGIPAEGPKPSPVTKVEPLVSFQVSHVSIVPKAAVPAAMPALASGTWSSSHRTLGAVCTHHGMHANSNHHPCKAPPRMLWVKGRRGDGPHWALTECLQKMGVEHGRGRREGCGGHTCELHGKGRGHKCHTPEK